MRYRQLSPTGDYTWGQSALNFYVNSPATVGQAIKTRLLLFQGEWFLDNQIGLPLLDGIIGKHPKSLADTTVLDTVTGTTGVVDVTAFESTIEPATRAYTVSQLRVNTIYGPTQVQIQNYKNY